MKKVLLLGALGMLGHKVWQRLASHSDVIACIHGVLPEHLREPGKLPKGRLLENIDLSRSKVVQSTFIETSPEIVINCAGVLTQPRSSKDVLSLLKINAELPHQLAVLCAASINKCKLIHISSDGVFSGKAGNYSEQDQPDAVDYYGMSKILGEVKEHGLNIRTSIIGFQIDQPKGLLEWLFTQKEKEITGYDGYTFSGMTTTALARIIDELIKSDYKLDGTVHVGTKSITKYELLKILNEAFSLDCQIERSAQASPTFCGKIDRSLNSSTFYRESGLVQPTWQGMIDELTEEMPVYKSGEPVRYANGRKMPGGNSNA